MMKIDGIEITNFKSIRHTVITDVDTALILVGKNNAGKSSVIDAIRAMLGDYEIRHINFYDMKENVVIGMKLSEPERDENRQDGAYEEIRRKHHDVRYIVTPNGDRWYEDESGRYSEIPDYMPKAYYIDHQRDIKEFQQALLNLQGDESVQRLVSNRCPYQEDKVCDQCFHCIPELENKTGSEMTLFDTAKLMEYRLYKLNLDKFSERVNTYLSKNGMPYHSIRYEIDFDTESLLNFDTAVYNNERNVKGNLGMLSAGSKSIYLLSLLEAYTDENVGNCGIIIIEDPEIYLHPQLQKMASEILYRFAKKNQLIFSTYSPNMIFNFSSRQIKQVVLSDEFTTEIQENVDIDVILDDLGYSANDLMNVSFVFIVEGKQDSSRLPMLLEKYYSEIRDEDGSLKRISIVTTNSCTNIKTYANLKYINQLYLKDQFLMIRDSDGKNPKYLVKQLCNYYRMRAEEDNVQIPNVTPKNVLVLKYYSFENYFLDPVTMKKIGVIRSEDEFYSTLYQKYKDYLYRLPSVKRLVRKMNVRINSKEDIRKNMELIKIYVRGHNLFDIFYGKYRHHEDEILREYVECAPREVFGDILDAIDSFVYFENRKKYEE